LHRKAWALVPVPYRSRDIGVAIFVANAIRARLPDQSDLLSIENRVAICNATFATASLKS
jgi:hypothetical protein